MLIRFVSFSEKEEREEGMAGSGSTCSSTFSGKGPGPKRGVSKSEEASPVARTSFRELELRREPWSAARDRMEAESSFQASCDSRLALEKDGRVVLTGQV